MRYTEAASLESSFGFRKSIASVFESERIYVDSAAKGPIDVRDGDERERQQQRKGEYLYRVEFEIVGAE